MKSFSILLASLFILNGILHGDEVAAIAEATNEPQSDSTQYCVELSEFELQEPIAIGLNEAEVIQTILQSDAKPIETIRLIAMPNTPSNVRKGKQVAVVTSTMTRGDVTTRQTKDIEIGTTLRIQMGEDPRGVLVNIDYITARIEDDTKGDSKPDILNSTIQTTLVCVPGKMRLVSTIGSKQLTAVVVTIHECNRTETNPSK